MFWACSILYNYLKSIHYFFNTFSASPCLHKNIIFVKLITIYLQVPHPDHSSIFDPYIDTLTRLAYKVFIKKYKKKNALHFAKDTNIKGKKSHFLPLERIKSGIFMENNYYHIYATQRATAIRIQLRPGAGTLLLIVWKTFGMQTMWSHKLFFLCTYKLPHAHVHTHTHRRTNTLWHIEKTVMREK